MKKLLILVVFATVMVACSTEEPSPDCKKCADFGSQSEARRYAASNPSCGERLDADDDGIYCESLPK